MSETHVSKEAHQEPELYEIRIHGHLDARWVDWFEGLTFSHENDGTTILSGPVIDQAALHGWLRKVRDLGLPLISVIQVNYKQTHDLCTKKDTNSKHSKRETHS